MSLAAFASYLSIGIFFIGFLPYLVDIHKKNVKPHVLSWVGWGFVTLLGAAAMVYEGSSWIFLYIGFQGLMCFVIALWAIHRKVAVFSTGKQDFVLFVLGIIGLILWQITGVGEIALIFAILADAFFGIPTIIKTYKDPFSETKFPWTMNVIADMVALFAIQEITFSETAYPLYLLVFDLIVWVLVMQYIRRR